MTLSTRLMSTAYAEQLRRLDRSDSSFFNAHAAERRAVLDAPPPDRPRVWLRHHIREPRFDNPSAQMPSFGPDALPDEELDAVRDYVSQLR
jgi:hypothetical protein